jgi:hypothetical protein
MDAARTSETSVNYQTPRRYNPEDRHLRAEDSTRIALNILNKI